MALPFQETLVVIPTYNEADNIVPLLKQFLEISEDLTVFVVDDHSPDHTADLVRSFGHRNTRLIERDHKAGRGSAALEGFTEGLKDRRFKYIIEMDADHSHNPDELPRLLEALEHADVVIQSRYILGGGAIGWSWKRRLFSRWANRIIRWRLKIPVWDFTNGYRGYRRKVLETIDFTKLTTSGFITLSETLFYAYLNGFRIVEVPSVFVNRRRGKSNLSMKEIVNALRMVWRIPTKQGGKGHGP